MFQFCPACSATPRELDVNHDAGTVTCPCCGDTRPFDPAPLYVVTGAPGAGKTTVYREVIGTVPATVVEPDLHALEGTGDVASLWRDIPEESRQAFSLLQHAELARSGQPVVSFGALLADADTVDQLPEADYFPDIRWLALVCDADEQVRRLQARTGFAAARDAGEPWADLEASTALTARIRTLARERDDYTLLDTTDVSVQETAERVRAWLPSASV